MSGTCSDSGWYYQTPKADGKPYTFQGQTEPKDEG